MSKKEKRKMKKMKFESRYTLICILIFVQLFTMILSFFIIHRQFRIMAELTAQWNASTILHIPSDADSYYIDGEIDL